MWDHLFTTSLLHYIVKEAFFNQMKEVGSVHCSELLIRLQRNKASSHQVKHTSQVQIYKTNEAN